MRVLRRAYVRAVALAMYGADRLQSCCEFFTINRKESIMNAAKIKDALMTTAVVLGVIWALNQTPAKPFVQKALGGGA